MAGWFESALVSPLGIRPVRFHQRVFNGPRRSGLLGLARFHRKVAPSQQNAKGTESHLFAVCRFTSNQSDGEHILR